MCEPKFFDVDYDINPWMTKNKNQVNKSLANKQWFDLVSAVSRSAVVQLVNAVEALPDLVFTANAGLVCKNQVVLSKFSKPQRSPEEQYFKKWFEDHGFNVFQPQNSYEGEGDHLIDCYQRHWLGSGFRSNPMVADELASFLGTKISILRMVDPRWYHLDTCFCPLPQGELLWYPQAFDEPSREIINQAFEKQIQTSLEDALAFACNCIVLGMNLFIPQNNAVSPALEALGYRVQSFDLSEFIKSGGAAKCLTLSLDR